MPPSCWLICEGARNIRDGRVRRYTSAEPELRRWTVAVVSFG
jgi:hypothetical protein